MTLDEIFDHGKEFAKHAFEMQGELSPMWIVETAEGDHFPIVMPFEDRDSKELAIEALKKLLKDKGAVRYVSMVEAWVYEAKPGEDFDDVMDKGPIRDHPDRKEIVHIIAEDKYHIRCGHFYIERPDGKKPCLSEFRNLDGKMEGLFTHLLESGEATH